MSSFIVRSRYATVIHVYRYKAALRLLEIEIRRKKVGKRLSQVGLPETGKNQLLCQKLTDNQHTFSFSDKSWMLETRKLDALVHQVYLRAPVFIEEVIVVTE